MSDKLSNHLNGRGIAFVVEEDGKEKEFALRAPMSNERDTASRIEAVEKRFLLMYDEDIKQLAELPAPEGEIAIYKQMMAYEEEQMRAEVDEEELENLERRIKFMRESVANRTAADTPLEEASRLKRNRYLAKVLLVDNKGNEVDIDKESIFVQDTASRTASRLWDELNELPFLSDQFSKQK